LPIRPWKELGFNVPLRPAEKRNRRVAAGRTLAGARPGAVSRLKGRRYAESRFVSRGRGLRLRHSLAAAFCIRERS